ncbi:DegT/DnrJ/EryC1/StrS family aminotransferase [uncultured Brachyspira sp.]|uniref:DegT/DnrJ/EryC1/StrS family aminotransferase n=1 Tax=uncultured Brachyspira sp. TaxID=221953 RepID=UPI00262F3E4D|nr:DegT/DnrJ/EryC1/StrS family aminotransferase [uncultured Brachyspira sp.]
MKYMNLYRGYEKRKEAINKKISSVIERSQFIFGEELDALEKELSDYTGVKYAVGVSSGHVGLVLSLLALGFDAGEDHSEKEIIVPAMTFFSTAEAPAFLGMKVKVCDIDKYFNMDIKKLESLINKNTAAIIPVNLFGQCADYNAILDIAEKNNIFVIEDACQSFGASYNNIKSCSGKLGDIAVTSFFPAKPLGCFGDGGMVFTNNEKLYNNLKQLRHHGDEGGMIYVKLGTTGRLDNMQAGILLEKFKGFDDDMEHRRKAAEYYSEQLKDIVKTPEIAEYNTSVYAQYVIQVENNRDEIRNKLNELGVPTALYYPHPIHLAPALSKLGYKEGDMPVSEYASKHNIALPIDNDILREEQDIVIEALRNVLKKQ